MFIQVWLVCGYQEIFMMYDIFIFDKNDYLGIYSNCETLRDLFFKQMLKNVQKLQTCLAQKAFVSRPGHHIGGRGDDCVHNDILNCFQNISKQISKSDRMSKNIFG